MRALFRCLLPLLFVLDLSGRASAQRYFPPRLNALPWAQETPVQLGWNQVALDSVLAFVGRTHGKSFLMLHNGKMVVEQYYGSFTRDSLWYWASAGKTLTSTLVGIAQEEGLLSISDSTSRFLGAGWTSLTPAQEGRITIRHQLTMTSGLDDDLVVNGVPISDDCLLPSCLTYLAPPGTRWAYHNAPYRLLQNVVAAASGATWQQYTNSRIATKIGMAGIWYDGIYYSRARDMARFGLLLLNRGTWDTTRVLRDTAYFRAMTTRSQPLNHSYGYLTWLNGQDSYMAPTVRAVFPGSLVPSAPADLYAALGKNDQKIYVVPSLNLVVVRNGETAGARVLGPSSFDDQLWQRLMRVFSQTTGLAEIEGAKSIAFYPNPATETIRLTNSTIRRLELFDGTGRRVRTTEINSNEAFSVRGLAPGLYALRGDGRSLGRLIIQ
jgi:CubicO group peptidase (beta-lactamase class C family)